MVTQSIRDVAEKSWDWYSSRTPKKGSLSNATEPLESASSEAKSIEALKFPELGQPPADQASSSIAKYWNLAQNAAENTYSAVSGTYSTVSEYVPSIGLFPSSKWHPASC